MIKSRSRYDGTGLLDGSIRDTLWVVVVLRFGAVKRVCWKEGTDDCPLSKKS